MKLLSPGVQIFFSFTKKKLGMIFFFYFKFFFSNFDIFKNWKKNPKVHIGDIL
jgi:hypothetical protein